MTDLDDLKHRIRTEWAKLDHAVIAAVVHQWRRRLSGCVKAGDVHFEHYLWTPAQRKRATMLYFANVFLFIYLFILWPPYSPALVNGDSRKFYMW